MAATTELGGRAARADRGLGRDHRRRRGGRAPPPTLVRAATARLAGLAAAEVPAARARRPHVGPPGVQPGQRHRQRAGAPAASSAQQDGGVVAEATLGLAYEGPPELPARRDERPVHGPAARRGRRRRGAVGHDGPPGDSTTGRRSRWRRRWSSGPPSPRARAASRSSPARSPSATPPTRSSSRRAAIFVMPRPEEVEAYFGVDHRRRRDAHPAAPAQRRGRPRPGLTGWTTSRWPRPPPGRPPTCWSSCGPAGLHRPRARGRRGRRRRSGRSSTSCVAERPDDVVFSEEAVDDPRRLAPTASGSSTRSTAPVSTARPAGTTGRCTWRCGRAASWTAAAVALPGLGEVL